MDIDTIISKVESKPELYLGRKSLSALVAFINGFEFAHLAYTSMPLSDPIDNAAWFAWVQENLTITQEFRSRLNAFSGFSIESYAQLMSRNDSEAFDRFITLRRSVQSNLTISCPVESKNDEMRTAQSIETAIDCVIQRPSMYLGNGCSTHELFAFIQGYLDCEKQLGTTESENCILMSGFQAWLNLRYPFVQPRPWGHLFHFLALGAVSRAFEIFSQHFEMYCNGESADAMDYNQRQIIENITTRSSQNSSEFQ